MKNDISLQMTDIFSLSFSTRVFSFEFKFAHVIPIHKKGSTLKCWNSRLISLLSTLDEYLEKDGV